ncbi:MAG: DNA pilot protein [Microviridae sp.]|nr:MAG: DNA pilot protein [Microviridae sp.]
MSAVLAAGVTGAASLLGSVASGIGARRENRLAYQRSIDLMNRQNQMNIDNWQMENRYNSDISQVLRRRAAGLNPVTIDGTSNAGQMSGVLPASQQGAPVPDFSAAVQSALQSRQLELQEKLIDSQVNKNNADADASRGNTNPARADMALKRSASALNDATRSLLAKQGLSETTRNEILKLDKSLRELDLKRLNSEFTVKGPNGKVISGPLYMADAIKTGVDIALQFENLSGARVGNALKGEEYKIARHRYRITKAEADSYIDVLKANLANVWSSVRKNSSSAEAQEFENSVNKYLKDYIREQRRMSYDYQINRDHNQRAFERNGIANVGRFINAISPLKFMMP